MFCSHHVKKRYLSAFAPLQRGKAVRLGLKPLSCLAAAPLPAAEKAAEAMSGGIAIIPYL
jgi:hypothetical protein